MCYKKLILTNSKLKYCLFINNYKFLQHGNFLKKVFIVINFP